jgi:hypothetical protein
MASKKRQRKESKLAREQSTSTPRRQRDGDRRHRGAMTVDQALVEKRLLHSMEMIVPPDVPKRPPDSLET